MKIVFLLFLKLSNLRIEFYGIINRKKKKGRGSGWSCGLPWAGPICMAATCSAVDAHRPWMQDPTALGCHPQPDACTNQGSCGDARAHLGGPFSARVGSLESGEDTLSSEGGVDGNGDDEKRASPARLHGGEDGRDGHGPPAGKQNIA